MLKKSVIIIATFCSLLFLANYCSAELIPVSEPAACTFLLDETPNDKSDDKCDCGDANNPGCNVSVNGVFKWTAIAGAEKYVLDIDRYTQSEDNIYPDKLSPECNEGDQCYFPFPNLTCCDISRSSENFLEQFCWHITAFDENGGLLGSSDSETSEKRCFVTEQMPSNYHEPWEYSPPAKLKNPISFNTFEEALKFLLNSLFLILIVIAVIMVIWAAAALITSGGNPQKINSAKKIIIWAIVALAIALLAKIAPDIIKGLFGGEGG